MAKTALVMSGGGSKGAFTVGVLKFIKEQRPEINFDVICGTSTGSLIAPLAATGEIAKLEEFYTTKTTGEILIFPESIVERFTSKHTGIFNVQPLFGLIKDTVNDARYNALMNSGKEIFLATVSLQSGKVTYFTNTNLSSTKDYDMIKISDLENFQRAVLASADQPVLMPAIEIFGKQYVDGGLREYAPMQAALASGATDIYVVLLSPDLPNKDDRKFEELKDILFRTLDLFSEDVSANDIIIPKFVSDSIKYINTVKQRITEEIEMTEEEIDELFDTDNNPFGDRRELNIHIIRPEAILESDGLEFIPAQMKSMMSKGFARAQEYFRNIPSA
jgi:NTE family protein